MARNNTAFNPDLEDKLESTITENYYENQIAIAENLQNTKQEPDSNAIELDYLKTTQQEGTYQQLVFPRPTSLDSKSAGKQSKTIEHSDSEVGPAQGQSVATQLDSSKNENKVLQQENTKEDLAHGKQKPDSNASAFNDLKAAKQEEPYQQLVFPRPASSKSAGTQAEAIEHSYSEVGPTQGQSVATQLDSNENKIKVLQQGKSKKGRAHIKQKPDNNAILFDDLKTTKQEGSYQQLVFPKPASFDSQNSDSGIRPIREQSVATQLHGNVNEIKVPQQKKTEESLAHGKQKPDSKASKLDYLKTTKQEGSYQQLVFPRPTSLDFKSADTQTEAVQHPASSQGLATQLDGRERGEAINALPRGKSRRGFPHLYGDPRCCMFNRKCLVVTVFLNLFLLLLFVLIILLIPGTVVNQLSMYQGSEHCLDSPCKNGGTCLNQEKGYFCVCAAGWKGINCSIKIEKCASNPCKNGGDCTDLVNGYNCRCTLPWYGKDCDVQDIDECSISHECDSDAFCVNTVGSHVCECIPGYYRNRQNVCTAVSIITGSNGCGGITTDSTGTKGSLWSPNFPGNYPDNSNCKWSLSSQVNISMNFKYFNTENTSDRVYIYDGASTTAPLIGEYSGSSLPPSAASSSNQLYLKFRSDGKNSPNGFIASYEVTQSGSLRLAGGRYNYGRVEIYLNGEWGTICDRSWDINDANVVCRQLGFAGAVFAHLGAYYGQGSGRIWLDNVCCSGSENHLIRCIHNGFGAHSQLCSHSSDASVECQPFIRLRDGGANYGRVEIHYSGQWGTVCDDSIDTNINGAHVICRMLGFPSARSYYDSAYYGEGSGLVWLDDVDCAGSEASITQCQNSGWGINNCDHSEDFSVYCNK